MVIDPVKKHGTYAREIHAARNEISLSQRGVPFCVSGEVLLARRWRRVFFAGPWP